MPRHELILEYGKNKKRGASLGAPVLELTSHAGSYTAMGFQFLEAR